MVGNGIGHGWEVILAGLPSFGVASNAVSPDPFQELASAAAGAEARVDSRYGMIGTDPWRGALR